MKPPRVQKEVVTTFHFPGRRRERHTFCLPLSLDDPAALPIMLAQAQFTQQQFADGATKASSKTNLLVDGERITPSQLRKIIRKFYRPS